MAVRLWRCGLTMATLPMRHDVGEDPPQPNDPPVEPEMSPGIAPDGDEEDVGHPPE